MDKEENAENKRDFFFFSIFLFTWKGEKNGVTKGRMP